METDTARSASVGMCRPLVIPVLHTVTVTTAQPAGDGVSDRILNHACGEANTARHARVAEVRTGIAMGAMLMR